MYISVKCLRLLDRAKASLLRLHRDERGVVSVLTVFATFLFTILLVMLINVARQIDDKIRMQNAADAATYSGSVAVARGLNALAFSNHLLCEVFALTAYMREGRDRNSEQLVPEILQAWQSVGSRFALSTGKYHDSQKFRLMGQAIIDKAEVEKRMVSAFGSLAQEQSRISLPLFEYILEGPVGKDDPLGGFIPRFQRAVVQTTPLLAETTADDLARRYGAGTAGMHRDQPLRSLLWRSDATPMGWSSERDPQTRTIPALDPSATGPDAMMPGRGDYQLLAKQRRRTLAFLYLEDWIDHWQTKYFEYPLPRDEWQSPRGDTTAKMSQYINLWRIFTCFQLNRLLDEEYPDTNLPHMLRDLDNTPSGGCENSNSQHQIGMEQDFQFVGTACWPALEVMFPGLFQNPLERDSRSYAVTFAQAEVYIPRARYLCCPWRVPRLCMQGGRLTTCWYDVTDNWPAQWDLFNQNWTARLMPATHPNLQSVLQTHPGQFVPGLLNNTTSPRVGNLTRDELQILSPH